MVTKYKKPHAINTISVTLLLLLGVAIYVIVCTWPVYALSSRAKGVLLDGLPMLYRANLRGDAMASSMIKDMEKGREIFYSIDTLAKYVYENMKKDS